jgi:SAM-dependent methyltransferase
VSPASRFLITIIARRYHAMIRAHARGRLLDLGCGAVPLYGMYRDLVSEITCVDWSNSLHNSSHIDISADLNGPLPLPDAGFDTVLLTDVLEHTAEPKGLMREVARILTPGGKLLLGVPFFYWLHEEPHDYYRFTRFALQRMLDESGLEVLEIDAYGGVPETLLDLSAKALVFVPEWVSRPLWKIHLLVARGVMSLNLAQRFSRLTSRTIPLGYCAVGEKPR